MYLAVKIVGSGQHARACDARGHTAEYERSLYAVHRWLSLAILAQFAAWLCSSLFFQAFSFAESAGSIRTHVSAYDRRWAPPFSPVRPRSVSP